MIDIDKLKALLADATPRPWTYDDYGQLIYTLKPGTTCIDIRIADIRGWGELRAGKGLSTNQAADMQDATGRLIVETINALPKLIAEAEAWQKISALPDCNDCARRQICPDAPGLGRYVRINCAGWEAKAP